MSKNKVIQSVKAHFAKVGHDIEFEIITAGVRRDRSWWYVPVITTRRGKDVPREVTVNIFANIEDELDQEQDINVLFVPAIAEEVATKSRSK